MQQQLIALPTPLFSSRSNRTHPWFETSVSDSMRANNLDWFGLKIRTVWIGLDCSIHYLVWFGLVDALIPVWVGLDSIWMTNYSQA